MNFFGNGQSLPQYGSVSNQGLDSPAQRLELPTAIGGGGQISSKGASRAFVVLTLFRLLEYYKCEYKRTSSCTSFPPNTSDLEECIRMAQHDAHLLSTNPSGSVWQETFRGVAFDKTNPGTYWTCASHFSTFYKNNISRKSKFQLMKEEALQGSSGRALFCTSVLALVANIKIYSEKRSFSTQSPPVEIAVPHPWPEYFTQDEATGDDSSRMYSISGKDVRLLSAAHGRDAEPGGAALHDINAGYSDSMMLEPDAQDGGGLLSGLDLGMFSSRKYEELLLQDTEPVNLLESSNESMWNKYPIESHVRNHQRENGDNVRAAELSDLSVTPDIFNVNSGVGSGYTTVDSDGEEDDTPLLCSSPGHKAAAQASSSSTSALSAVSNFFGSYFWNSDPSSDSHTVTSSLLPISSHIPAESSLLDGGRTPHGNSQRDRADSAYGYGRMGGGEQAVQGETRSRGML